MTTVPDELKPHPEAEVRRLTPPTGRGHIQGDTP